MTGLRRFLFLLIITTLCGSLIPQELNEENEEIKNLRERILTLERENRFLSIKLNRLDEKLTRQGDSILNLIKNKSSEIARIEKQLSSKIEYTDSSSAQRYSNLDESLSTNTIYWLIGFLLLLAISLIVFYLLRKRISSETRNIDKQIATTRKELEEEGIKLDNKLLEILNSQLKVIENEKRLGPEEKDHSLALKVADEIVRIEKNLANMDSNLKGHKQLNASIERIKDNFEASGYEIVEMLNKPYSEGINASVSFRIDENLSRERQIITRIIKQQVNYRGKMIQTSQIEVSQGE